MAVLMAPFLALLAVAITAAEIPPCAHDSCSGDCAAAGADAGLLQHTIQLVDVPPAQRAADNRTGRTVGMHYMMVLKPYVNMALTLMDSYVENVLGLETCFSEILLTLDHGRWMPGEDLNARRKFPGGALNLLNQSSATAWFFCGLKERTRYLAKTLEQRCGNEVSATVHVLDVSLPHVQEAAFRIFGSRTLPRRMFKNTFAYLYGPAVMKSDYIMHMDDDVLITRQGMGLFVEQAQRVFERSTEALASVSMPCCECHESQRFTPLSGSGWPQFSGLEVGQMNFTDPKPENAFPVPGVDVRSVCTTLQNFITMQAYVLHSERFRRMFPMRVEGVETPAMLHIECLLSGAAAAISPPTVFAWINTGAVQCRSLRHQTLPEVHHDPEPNFALGRCMGAPAEEARVP